MLDEFTKNAPSDPREKIKFLFEIYLKLMKENKVLCLNVYSQYFIVNHKARYKLFKNQVVSSLLNEMGIDDEEIVRKISIDFAMLLNRFFMYDLTSREFGEYEKEFFERLKKIINY